MLDKSNSTFSLPVFGIHDIFLLGKSESSRTLILLSELFSERKHFGM